MGKGPRLPDLQAAEDPSATGDAAASGMARRASIPTTGGSSICNLYSNRLSQHDMRQVFDVVAGRDHLGNATDWPAIWPKYEAPIVRLSPDGPRELVRAHWGFLTPALSKKTGKPIAPVAWNNARDDKMTGALWKDSFLHRRCLIPATSFREAKGRNPATDVWFALTGDDDRPPFAFAGLWRAGQPGVAGEAGDWLTHTMITTTANDLVRPVHPTRMPVILDPGDHDQWLCGSPADARALLRPYPADRMRIVREGVGILADGTG